jgi:hypothetical protein
LIKSSGWKPGLACNTNAATPETCGVEADVPKNGRSRDATLTPAGALISGFKRPSAVGPREL